MSFTKDWSLQNYYPSAQDTFGDNVQVLVEDEDRQALSEPIVAPEASQKVNFWLETRPETLYRTDYLESVSHTPEFIRNISIVGALHHGKTSFADLLINSAHRRGAIDTPRFLDTSLIERHRQMSIRSVPVTLLLPTSKGKHHCFHILDTPGHADFRDEVDAALLLSDGAVLVVDAVEGLRAFTTKLIEKLLRHRVRFVLVLSKLDRLVLELKLPVADAYYKLAHTIDSINLLVKNTVGKDYETFAVSPQNGSVVFASSRANFMFSLESFAQMYLARARTAFDCSAMAARLWGDYFYDSDTGDFVCDDRTAGPRTFVHFVLEPLYKLIATMICEDTSAQEDMIDSLGLPPLKQKQLFELDRSELLSLVASETFGGCSSFVDMCVKHLPNPRANSASIVLQRYMGPQDDATSQAMRQLDANAAFPVVQAVKVYCVNEFAPFKVLGRVLCGTVKPGSEFKVVSEAYISSGDEEGLAVHKVDAISFPCGRYEVPLEVAFPGNLVWMTGNGLDRAIGSSATLLASKTPSNYGLLPFKPTRPTVKVAVEPLKPSELPKLVEALVQVSRTFTNCVTKVEESGEHVVIGPGELFLDCVLFELRELFARIEIKVSEPSVTFCETVADSSSMVCFADSANRKNRISFVCDPMEDVLAIDIEAGSLKPTDSSILQETYDWDPLAAASIWCFGPGTTSPNILSNDTLPDETSAGSLLGTRRFIEQGFKWATREGPLCDEPMRGVVFKLTGAKLADDAVARAAGQIVPTTRRACYSAFLTAAPKLMEPVFLLEVVTPDECLAVVSTVIGRRRGHVVKESKVPGTFLSIVEAYVPAIDSFGLEVDIRSKTRGFATVQQSFEHWQTVPGDPLDRDIRLEPLQAAGGRALARDFTIKTRRRKGLGDDVSVTKYFDDSMLIEMSKLNQESMFM